MSNPSTVSGCSLCQHAVSMGVLREDECRDPDRGVTSLFEARMASGHCGPNRKNFKMITRARLFSMEAQAKREAHGGQS